MPKAAEGLASTTGDPLQRNERLEQLASEIKAVYSRIDQEISTVSNTAYRALGIFQF